MGPALGNESIGAVRSSEVSEAQPDNAIGEKHAVEAEGKRPHVFHTDPLIRFDGRCRERQP